MSEKDSIIILITTKSKIIGSDYGRGALYKKTVRRIILFNICFYGQTTILDVHYFIVHQNYYCKMIMKTHST